MQGNFPYAQSKYLHRTKGKGYLNTFINQTAGDILKREGVKKSQLGKPSKKKK